jgi:hypothetical protein
VAFAAFSGPTRAPRAEPYNQLATIDARHGHAPSFT